MREWFYQRYKRRGCWAYSQVWWHGRVVLKWRPFHAWYSLGEGRCCARCVKLQLRHWNRDIKRGYGFSSEWKDA